MMSFQSAEVKSGILIVLCLALLTTLTFTVGDFRAFGEVAEYRILFNHVNGLEKNAPVHFAGFNVGKVESITVHDGNPAVEVTIQVGRDTPIRTDSGAFVDTLGLLGEKLVTLTPGSESAPRLEPGAALEGTETVPIHQLVRQMNELTQNLIPLTDKTNRLLEGNEKEIEEILANLNEASRNLKEMTRDLKLHPWKLLKKGKGRRFLIF